MKWLILCILLSSFLIPVQGQEIVEQLYILSRKNEYKKVYRLIDSMKTQYLEDENWDSLTYIYMAAATIDFKRNQYEKMDTAIERAAAISYQFLDDNDPARLFYLVERAGIEMEFGEYEQSEKLLDSIIIGLGNDTTNVYFARQLVTRSFLMLYADKFNISKNLVKSAIQKLENDRDNSRNLAMAYSLLGYIYSYYGEVDKAMNIRSRNLELMKQIFGESHVNVGAAYIDAAVAYSSQNNNLKSIEYFQKGLDILYRDYEINNNPRILVNTLGNMALNYSRVNENFIAIDFARKALNIQLENNPSHTTEILWLYNLLCDLHLKTTNFKEAQYYNNQSLLLTENAEVSEQNKKIYLINKADINLHLDKPTITLEIAQKLYRDELEQDTQITRLEVLALNYISRAHFMLKNYTEAKKYIQIWHKKANKFHGLSSDDALLSVWSLWEIYVDQGQREKADSIYNYILKTWNDGSEVYTYEHMVPSNNVTIFASDIAKYYSGQFKVGKNIQKYHLFIEDFDAYFQKQLVYFSSDKTINSYQNHLIATYQPLLEEYLKNDQAQAFSLIEKLKNFHQRMLLSNKLIRDQKQENVQKTLNQLVKNSIDSNVTLNYDQISDNLHKFQVYKDSLYKHDRETYLKNYGMNYVDPDIVRKVVRNDEGLIEFLKVDSHFYRVSYINGNFYSDTLLYEEVASMIIELNYSYDPYLAEELYQVLIPSHIMGVDDLLIVPDDILYYLNFELLQKEGRFLIHDFNIRYATSVSINYIQDELHKSIESNGYISSFSPGFMPSLKSSLSDIYEVTDTAWKYYLQQPFLLGLSESLGKINGAKIFKEDMATEQNFKTQSGGHRIIHLGTHGILKDDSPLFSKLILVMDSIEDGNLHVYELYNQNLNSQLAVLAACSSGKGELMTGEGIVSIAQAFIKAGVPAVLLSMHDVDEKSTTRILENFYDNLIKGDTKSVALRKAKLKFLKDSPPELHDPYYWAGLIVIGSDEPIFSSPFYTNPWFLGALVLLLSSIFWWVFTRKKENND